MTIPQYLMIEFSAIIVAGYVLYLVLSLVLTEYQRWQSNELLSHRNADLERWQEFNRRLLRIEALRKGD